MSNLKTVFHELKAYVFMYLKGGIFYGFLLKEFFVLNYNEIKGILCYGIS